MSVLVSHFSPSSVATVSFAYTTASLVSDATGGEVEIGEVRTEWIQEAMEEIDRRTSMSFRPKNFTEDMDGNDLIRIFARSFPVLDISEVTINGVVIAPVLYAINRRTGSVTLKDGIFPEGVQNVSLSGVYGYESLPPLIEKIATLIVAKTALSAKNGPLVDNESIGDFSQSRSFKKVNDELDRAWAAWGVRANVDFT